MPTFSGRRAQSQRSNCTIRPGIFNLGATVKAHDPVAIPTVKQKHPELNVICCDTPEQLAADCDALYRLRHHAHVITLRGDSYRVRNRLVQPRPIDGKEESRQLPESS